jgi:hypothetical protein
MSMTDPQAVTLREGSSIDADKAVDAGIMQWHTSTDSNMARRSAYGNRDVNITTSEPILPRAFHLSGKPNHSYISLPFSRQGGYQKD